MSTIGFFDEIADEYAGATQAKTFVKWDGGIGQSYEGVVDGAGVVDHPFPDAEKQASGQQPKRVPAIQFVNNGTLYDLTATQKQLIQEIIRANPGKGDHIRITHVENVKIKGRPQPMKKFAVVVTPNGSKPAQASNNSNVAPF